MICSKLGIGTVQFGLDYGISNQHGKTSPSEAAAILQYAKQSGITLLDTARAYGDSEKVLGGLAISEFRIVSKFQTTGRDFTISSELQSSLDSLKLQRIYGYIAHNADDIIRMPELWLKLNVLKQEGLIDKIGFSLYYPAQLQALWSKNVVPDLVQLPYNLLDRKFEPYFKRLQDDGTEIHIRSVFLQGLFFLGEDEIPESIRSLGNALSEIKTIVKGNRLTTQELALNFVVHNPYINYVIMGVNEVDQLKSNVKSLKTSWSVDVNDEINRIRVPDPELLNPVNWK